MTHSGLSHLPLAPSLPLSLWLDYGDVFHLSSPPPTSHPSLPFSAFSLHISVAFPCLFIYSPPGKGGCQSLPSVSPSSNLPHIPSSFPTRIHLSLLPITVTPSPLSVSSLPASLGPFRKLHLRSFLLQSLPLFILVLSPLFFCIYSLICRSH